MIRTRHILLGVALLGMLPLCTGCAPLPVCATFSSPLCHDVGVNYEHGAVGYGQSKEKAVIHYQAACGRGLARSCRAACNLEDARSCNRLGLLIARRHQDPRWRKQARSAFGRACELGSARGCGNVAKHMLRGRQTGERVAQARAFLAKACEGGFQPACTDLKKWAEPTPPPAESTAPEPSSAPPDENTTEAPPPQPENAPAAPPSTVCGEGKEASWVGFGSVEMVWCGNQFVLRTLDTKEMFRITGGAQGADTWVHVGAGGKAVCVDFLSARLGKKDAQSARCYVIDENTGFPTVESDETGTRARFAGAAWHVSAKGNIDRSGIPELYYAEGRFELRSASVAPK